MGKELDSLADMVSFGVMPSVMAFFLIRDLGYSGGELFAVNSWQGALMYVPFLVPAFSAYRLAKFNLDVRQTHSFIGLPTPSNALFWVMLVFTRYYQEEFFMAMWGKPWGLALFAVVLAMVLSTVAMADQSDGTNTGNTTNDTYTITAGKFENGTLTIKYNSTQSPLTAGATSSAIAKGTEVTILAEPKAGYEWAALNYIIGK